MTHNQGSEVASDVRKSMAEPHDCDRCGETYDEARGDGYCGLCPSCADGDCCEICGSPLDDSEPWKRGLDGMAAHTSCVSHF